MSVKIHPTAIISENVVFGENVEVGPYVIIDDDVQIGAGTTVQAFSCIGKGARIGCNCDIGPSAMVSTPTVDLSYEGEEVFTFIGDSTSIKEFVVIHNGTKVTGKTQIGKNCLIMAYSHIAHDCVVGDNVIIANGGQLAGHVLIEDFATLGGTVKVHQFCRVGTHSMIGVDSYLNQDAPPYSLIAANPNLKMFGLNAVGLKRRNFSPEIIKELNHFYRLLLRSGLNISDALVKYKNDYKGKIIEEVANCITFIECSKRGIIK
ncbi:MAG: acyl-ACP--UDP-N-acetylglucosamine O-acyltransferase [bacterium]